MPTLLPVEYAADQPVAHDDRLPKVINARIPVLDGLRGIAILLVLLFHIHISVANGDPRSNLGWAGVDLFFVVSGFLITGILYDSRRNSNYYRVFYGRRTLRIFPLYYVTLVGFFVVFPAVLRVTRHAGLIDPVIRPSTQIFAWFYLLNWLIGLRGFAAVSSFLQHFWSLSVEEQFYLCWPLVVRRATSRSLMPICAVLILLSPILRAILFRLDLPWAAYTWTVCRCDSLAIGALIAIAARNLRAWSILSSWARPVAIAAVLALAGIIATRKTAFYQDSWMGTVGLSFLALFFGASLVIALNAARTSRLSAFLQIGPLRFFGKYSYGLYVFHWPVMLALTWKNFTVNYLAGAAHGWFGAYLVVSSVSIGVTVLLALISWNLLEKRCLNLKDHPLLKRQQAARSGVLVRVLTLDGTIEPST
jgi:peptidoglycan/LPS O-acetylase OafA/YrhL